jgi:hypothetical protein
MEKIVIAHVKASELPEQWSKSINAKRDDTFTVTLAPERGSNAKRKGDRRNPLFGIWADRTDLSDVGAYVRSLRKARAVSK